MENTMDDAVTGTRVDVTLTVDVPRAQLWELITDVSRFGQWSPECTYAAWLDPDSPGPRVGARFEGRNRYSNGYVNSVTCLVIEAEPPTRFAWVVLDGSDDPARPASIWRYELLPGDRPDQTLIRHGFQHGPGDSGARQVARMYPGSLTRRLAQLRQNMTATLTAMTRSLQPTKE
jgi:uncharacterized protein YndB with AHSA1/START domain